MERQFHVYLMTDHRNGTFYVGLTSDLARRCEQHRCGHGGGGFTARYGLKHLVWFETHADPEQAIRREKRIKRWTWIEKMKAIEAVNPQWRDLSYALGGASISDCPLIPDPRARRG
ncbi:GIY-YIG nuclease family protein [Minwuia sp.]|uniref:GIY-YIG nuclease family protein n=1 Tax=Minwuia sp. TaxID=2493630 RepID=UPI003A8F49A7